MLNWGHGGWVHFFTKEPVTTVEDFKRVKMWTSAGDDRWVQWWKDNGFHPVALATTDLLTGLQTGMVEGLPTTPLAALSMQWFRHAPNMLDVGLAPLVGATVVSKRTWNRIPEELRPELHRAAKTVERRLMEEVPAQDESSVVEMKKRGLQVTAVIDGEHGAEWRKAAAEFAEKMRGGMVPADIFELALRAREEYRSNRAAGGTN
jgi:TRAP-type C4-dicarboxylate transport system substrate-binding protein